MPRVIEFYRTSRGDHPVEEFVDQLPDKESQKVLWIFRLIERVDQIPSQYFRKLTDSDDIWECRVATSGSAYRFFCFFWRGNRLVLTHGYSKKTQRTDPREISRAERYRQDYLDRHGE